MLTAKQSSDLVFPVFIFKQLDRGNGSSGLLLFFNEIMSMGLACNLGMMGNADNLMIFPKPIKLLTKL